VFTGDPISKEYEVISRLAGNLCLGTVFVTKERVVGQICNNNYANDKYATTNMQSDNNADDKHANDEYTLRQKCNTTNIQKG
jgi:hypothetical protein